MPRKPGLGPRILRIESMSTGREYHGPLGADDFTGQPIKPRDTQPIKPLASADELTDQHKRLIRDNQRAMLAAVMPQVMRQPIKPKGEPRLVVPNIPGKRAIVVGGFALLMDKPGWRR